MEVRETGGNGMEMVEKSWSFYCLGRLEQIAGSI